MRFTFKQFEENGCRRAFTLIELLVVMVIIGILIGLLLPAVMSALNRANSFAIETDVTQLSASVESFKNKYGFYPPDFARVQVTPGIAAKSNVLVPYLNRIAPNHSELQLAGSPWPATYRRIDVWMEEIGQHLAPDSALVFWLSGLVKNKQYPLTYVDGANEVHGHVAYNGGAVGTIEREVFFDFKNDRLTIDSTTAPVAGAIARYTQVSGRPEFYVYFELASLATYPPVPGWTVAGVTVTPYEDLAGVLYNKTSFQVLAPGVDGVYSADPSGSPATTLVAPSATKRERDNVTNFSEGRLEIVITQ